MGFALVEVRQPGRKPLVLAVQGALELGRDCDGLLLMDAEVSRRHAVVRIEGDKLVLEDLKSTNGTLLNGQRIDAAVPIGEGDVGTVGATEIRVVSTTDLAAGPAAVAPARGRFATVMSTTDPGGKVKARSSQPDTARQTSIDVVASAAGREEFDAAKLNAEGGTVTIVFSDIESSTELAMKLGDTQWFDLLGVHNEIVRRHVKEHRGTEIKSQGDGFMLTFPSARSAVRAACEVQEELAARAAANPDDAIRIRIGIHTGEAIADAGGDLFGRHIIVAARIANLAEGGEVLVSGVTKEIVATGDFEFGEVRHVSLKGIEGEYPVAEVLWQKS